MLKTAMSQYTNFFFHTRLSEDLIRFFTAHGVSYKFKKKSVVPAELVENNLLMLKSGLVSNTQYISFGSKERLSMYILPYRLVDHQLVLLKEFTACKAIEVSRDSEILAVRYEEIQNLIYSNPELHISLLKECGYSSRRYMHLPIFLLSMSPEKKATRFMYDMIVAHNADISAEWVKLPLKLTREEHANTLYISLIKFDLLLNKWHKDNLIRRDRGELVVNTKLFDGIDKCAMESIYSDRCNIYRTY